MSKISTSKVYNYDPDDLIIITDPSQQYYDERAELPVEEKLVKNFMFNSQGILQNIIIAKDDDGKPIVIAGKQRVKAAREANKRLKAAGLEPLKVPCRLRKGSESDLMGIMISENECRRNTDPFSKAELCQKYIDLGNTQTQASELFGVSNATICNWIKLLDLSDKIKDEVRNGFLSVTAALQLSDLSRNEQNKTFEQAKQIEQETSEEKEQQSQSQSQPRQQNIPNTNKKSSKKKKRAVRVTTIRQQVNGSNGNNRPRKGCKTYPEVETLYNSRPWPENIGKLFDWFMKKDESLTISDIMKLKF
jgi:ParB family chromosome partitioning protein